jgi:hypothetical protein
MENNKLKQHLLKNIIQYILAFLAIIGLLFYYLMT